MRYRYDRLSAHRAGEIGSPQGVVLELCPSAHNFELTGHMDFSGSPRFLLFDAEREFAAPPFIVKFEPFEQFGCAVEKGKPMVEKIRIYEAAKELGLSEKEVLTLLGPDIRQSADRESWGPRVRNRMSIVTRDELDALKRQIARNGKRLEQVSLGQGVVLRGERIIAEAPTAAPVIQITADMAALLSLQELTGDEPPPARKFRIEIKPPLDGLKAIDVVARQVTPEWKKGPKTEEDLSKMLRAIAFGACGILAQQKAAAPKKEPNPLGERDAYMRDEITVKIQTKISETVRRIVSDVISGRRGYSNVLCESIAVRAHFAKYHTGKGRTKVTPILRAAHRRGGPGDKERTYKVRS